MLKKRILFVNNSSRLGLGTSVSLLLLLKYLSKEFDCAVVSDIHSKQLPDALAKLNIRHYALPDRLIFYLPFLVKVILWGKYDIVYANGSNERSRGAFWASKLTRRPLIWHVRESISRKKYTGTIRFADCVIANSIDTAERLIRYANVANPMIVPNGVEIQSLEHSKEIMRKKIGTRFGLNHDWLRVINIGRICPDKNQADLIYVAREVISLFPNIYFVIVGAPEPEYAMFLKQLVFRFKLEKQVVFFDYSPDIMEILQGCDVMLHVSKKESQGRVLLEAMSVGLPVVAYDVGGIGETILDGETGYLLSYGDLNGLFRAVCKLIVDPSKREQMGSAGHQHVLDNFFAERSAQLVREVINQVLEKDSMFRHCR